jgi:hypothetical protein
MEIMKLQAKTALRRKNYISRTPDVTLKIQPVTLNDENSVSVRRWKEVI